MRHAENMKIAGIVIAAAAVGSMTLGATPVSARGSGFHAPPLYRHWHGGHRWHGRYTHRWPRYAGQWPAYGGDWWPLYGSAALMSPEQDSSDAQPIPTVVWSPPQLTCQRSQQIVSIPTENGGTQQVTITRC